MKKTILLIFSFLVSLMILNCEKDDDSQTIKYSILSGACGTIELVDSIGYNFNSALDSLQAIREPMLRGGCPEPPCYSYYVDVDTLDIDFDSDTRIFLGIRFINIADDVLIFAMSDVIDSYGNYYTISWCED